MAYKQLTLKERYEIKAYMQAGISIPRIAEYIGVHKTTVYREVDRNRGENGYNSEEAQKRSDRRRKTAYKHTCFTDDVKERVEALLRRDLSPEQISGRLAAECGIYISHERIYQHVWAEKHSGGDLYTHLRHGLKKRRKRYGKYDNRGKIPDRVMIDQRPEIVNKKERIVDWEVDTVIGKNHKGALITAVERKTKFSRIGYVRNKRTDLVTKKLIEMLSPYQDTAYTITVDNGLEFASHKKNAKVLEVNVYFAHPYRSWERGLNENTNGLIRQYFPKKSSLVNVKERDIEFVEQRLNLRPRKSLCFNTPLESFLNIKVALGT
jgi:IS30 family transposase